MDDFAVVVGAGSLRGDGVSVPHRWTGTGVTVDAPFTGGHLLHLAVAGCVLNDCYREAEALGLALDGVRVTAQGGLEPGTWASTGIEYAVTLDGPDDEATARLLDRVDEVAEIPKAMRHGANVVRRS